METSQSETQRQSRAHDHLLGQPTDFTQPDENSVTYKPPSSKMGGLGTIKSEAPFDHITPSLTEITTHGHELDDEALEDSPPSESPTSRETSVTHDEQTTADFLPPNNSNSHRFEAGSQSSPRSSLASEADNQHDGASPQVVDAQLSNNVSQSMSLVLASTDTAGEQQPLAEIQASINPDQALVRHGTAQSQAQQTLQVLQDKAAAHFSWRDAHPLIVTVVAGHDPAYQQAFSIQKDFLCYRSPYFRNHFFHVPTEVNSVIELPDIAATVFGYVQQYLYTGVLFSSIDDLPPYDDLVGIWRAGHKLGIDGLCDAALDGMRECRRITDHIPATALLVQVWETTPEGSSIRELLLGWAAEYMRSSDMKAQFAKELPKEVLSELVVALGDFDRFADTRAPPPSTASTNQAVLPSRHAMMPQSIALSASHEGLRKDVHYMDRSLHDGNPPPQKKMKRTSLPAERKVSISKKSGPGRKWGTGKGSHRKPSSAALAASQDFSPERRLEFCANLLSRMLSGPGFWTRLVGPFKVPVVPETDGVRDYFEKVKRPMDLGTIKDKMDSKQYKDDSEFVADVRQIFENCYTYWTDENNGIRQTCMRFQKTFEEKYAEMPRWLLKAEGQDAIIDPNI